MAHFRWCLTLLAFVISLGGSALAQDNAGDRPNAGQDPDDEVRTSRVIIDGDPLFLVRGVTARPADRRAREIADRIRSLASDPKVNSRSLVLEEHPPATWIMAGSLRVMVVLDEDAALEQTSRHTLAELYRVRIAETIEAYRHDRRSSLLWLHAAYAVSVTMLLVGAVVAGRRIVARLRSVLERHLSAHIHGLEDRAFHIVKSKHIWRALTGLVSVASNLVLAVMLYAYLNYVLALFPWTRGLAKNLFAIAIDPVRTVGSGLLQTVPKLAFLAILIVLTRYSLRVMRMLFEGLSGGTLTVKGFEAEWALPTYRLVRLLVIALSVIVAYPYIPGSGSEAFKGVSLFIGIVFSLGSSSLIGNFIAGYSMTYRRAFRLGDRVKIGTNIGDVERMRLMVTHLRTPKNEEVVVPNSMILGAEVVNYSSMAREQGLILHTTVGIGYETPWRQVEAMLLEGAARTAGLLRQPPPFVLQTALGDFCVTYEINVYCDTPKEMPLLYTELHRNILDVFNEYGVQIMTPAYERDPEQPKVVSQEQWYAAPAKPPAAKDAAVYAGSPSECCGPNRRDSQHVNRLK